MGSLENPLIVGKLGREVGRGARVGGGRVGGGRLVSIVAMVVVKIMLSVSGVAIIPL